MKQYNHIYYFLFILLVMGAFASMAQNNYGLKIMGGVAFVFALVFMVEFISGLLNNDKKDLYTLIEQACLFLLSFIFGLRIFYIYFPYVELLYGAAGVLLIMVYARKMLIRYRQIEPKNTFLAILVLVFHLSIILFLISLAIVPLIPGFSEVIGGGAFVFLLFFIIAGFFGMDSLIDGEKVSVFAIVRHFNDHSIIIVCLFLLFSLYFGLNRIGALPGIYSDEFPRAYFEMIDKATSKKEKPVDGKYRYEEFLEKYKQFLKHNSSYK